MFDIIEIEKCKFHCSINPAFFQRWIYTTMKFAFFNSNNVKQNFLIYFLYVREKSIFYGLLF